MSVAELVAEISDLGVRLWVEGDQLRFKAPQGALTPELKVRLAQQKSELLAFLREVQSSIKAAAAPPIRPVSREGDLRLSFAQEGLWLADQWKPGDVSYNLSHGICIEGRIAVPALEQSLTEIMRRHEVLRTTIRSRNGRPYQNISANSELRVGLVDLEALDQPNRDDALRRLISVETSLPFDLATGPLLRVWLIRLEAGQHVLLFNVHHIVFDAWTTDVLVREMAILYESFTEGCRSPLPELEIQYADFAEWQRQWLTGDRLEKERRFWKEQLAGAPASLDLPTDRPRPPIKTINGANYDFILPVSLSNEIRRFSQRERVTPFMVVLAALNVLLSRYSGQEDIVIGSPHANRNRSEIEGLIGFFVNSLVLRTDLSGDPAFIDLIARVRQATVAAQEHQDLPFEKLVEDLQAERDLSRTPIYQAVLNYQQDPTTEMAIRGVTLKNIQVIAETAKYDLELTITDGEEALKGEFEHSTDLFNLTTVARMAAQFEVLLVAALEGPDRRLSELPIMTAAEQHQLISEWNAVPARDAAPRDKCAHELFEKQAERTPDAVALVCVDEQLTYGQLNKRANQLARHLRGMGAGPESLVGLCMERSVEIIVGLMGILKAGAAYLPMDPKYPKDRLAFMLEDARASVLLTRIGLLFELPEWDGPLVCLDADWETIESGSGDNLDTGVGPGNRAYVIYTSGSSGNPKGVMVHHQSLVSYANTAAGRYEIAARDRVLQFCSISFDISGEEIYPCLLRGAALVLRTDAMLDSIPVFLEKCAEWQLSFMSLPTAYWHEIAASLGVTALELPPSLRMVIIAGESALPERLAVWRKFAWGRTRLINTYGPTEATISVTMCELSGAPEPDVLPEISIGRVIPDGEVYLLDRALNPASIGAPGEVYIGGLLLARGYLDRPEMTAEKFIPSSFGGKPGSRLYRSGDLARYWPDGTLRFVGRADQQVKIRGFRVELGEIETLLIRHSGVNQAVVTVREDGAGMRQLVAYVVPDDQSLDVSELRSFIGERLPEYMVPSFFVTLGELPLTPNGKVDRRALPEPERTVESAEYAAPRTMIEEMLAEIWADVLNVGPVGLNDNFFELGGHSLLATQLILQVQGAFDVELSLLSVFKTPTLIELAANIEETLSGGERQQLLPISRASRAADLPLSYEQQRLWFLDQLEPDNPFYNISGALKLSGQLDADALEKSLSEIVNRHESLRTIFASVNGEPSQIVLAPWPVKVDPIDLSKLEPGLRDEEANRLMAIDAQSGFDLARGPLFRAQLLRRGETEHVLLLTLHHIISDGWSMGILVNEFTELYNAFKTSRPTDLPELHIQYPDYAVWQRQWFQGDVFDTQMAFWKERLGGELPSVNLPTDRTRPAALSYKGSEHKFELPRELADSLRQLSRQEGVTLFMATLAVFQALLQRYSGQDDILIGTPIANRRHKEVEPLIGFFVNTLVLRTDLSGSPEFIDLMRRVRETALSAYAHQDMPFEKLVEVLQPERDFSRSPIFQVMFALAHGKAGGIELPDLEVSVIDPETGTAKFELSMTVEETDGELTGAIEHNIDLFDEATIRRMAGHYERLLTAAVACPDRPISQIELLTDAERSQILYDLNDTASDYPSEECIHSLFERCAEQTPEAVAVVANEGQLTYRELNGRADRLAHYLRALGVGLESRVGIAVHRSLEMLVGMFGVLKAGGAYIPLDPAYPQERLDFMLNNSSASVLLTQERLLDALPRGSAHAVCLDRDWEVVAQESAVNLDRVAPENVAYVIYTSGSTGAPKGVAIQHRSAVAMISWASAVFGPDELAGVLASTSICFDLSVFEIFVPLSCGGTVVLAENALALPSLAAASRVTLINTVPSAMAELARGDALPSFVMTVNLAGEPLSSALVQQVYRQANVARVYNLYGPSEDTTYSTYALTHDGEPVTIGRPVANSRLYLFDDHLEPSPIGVPGELFMGGDGLARGYLNSPELTAERFIPDPISGECGARLYRTGDLARHKEDGNVEYIGRADHQVKVRGFRIELAEIESALGGHPAVRDAVVIVWENEPGNKRLVAYIVPSGERSAIVTELRAHLKQKLPDYMSPSFFVVLEKLPLTPNGKIDRRALPPPDAVSIDRSQRFASPRTAVEDMLAGVWANVLKVERVGVDENFFEAGGHSLLATQLIARINNAFQLGLPVQSLFELPTVGRLAERIERMISSGEGSEIPPISPVSRDAPLPLSFAQENLWLFEQLAPDTPTYNTCRSGRVFGRLNPLALETTFNELLQRHESLRTSFKSIDGAPVQIVAAHQRYLLPLVDLSALAKEERESEALRLSNEDAQRPVSIANAPVARARLLGLGPEDHVFILTIHHIAYDLWSGGILLEEIEHIYMAYSNNEPPALPQLPVQYADFAVWQRNWLRGEILDRQLAYWKQRLAGLSSTPMEIPTDRPRPAVETMRGSSEYSLFSREMGKGIATLARREGVTQFMTLLSMFQLLLHRYAAQDDVVVGSAITNRHREELEGVVGFFDNTIVLRADASGNPTFRDFLHRVRDIALGAYANQHVPFELIIKELQPERNSNRTPLIQAMFVFLLNYPAMEREVAGLKVVPYNLNSGKAMFDLLLGVHESHRGLEAELGYNCDLFDAVSVKRMCGWFGRLIEAAVTNPEQPIDEMSLMTDPEREQVLVAWNQTARDYGTEVCLHELFEQQAARTPDSVAVVFEEDRITYNELNRRANRLANFMIKRGVEAEDRVGICLRRSIEMIVGIFGVLKAGAAYVPLDPKYPAERVAYMLDDAGVSILLTQEEVDTIAPDSAAEKIYPDRDGRRIAEESEANPARFSDPHNLAYVIYTSGSTGRPKGAGIAHRSAVFLLEWAREVYPEDRLHGVLASTSICFDLSIFELFLPLCFGGRVLLAENALVLPAMTARDEVTLVNTVPSALRELLNDGGLPASVRTVNLAGEPFSAGLSQQAYSKYQIERLYNLYGPTETTTYSTFAHISSDDAAPSIGQPIANTQVFVLDSRLKPVPVGMHGELYIGGVGLARGYLNRPELTAEKFTPNPFASSPGSRTYRTGDRVRWLADQKLEFAGRIDQQVKLRGYRIELGEIESALGSHPSVRDAVVIVREDVKDDKRLVAYIVRRDDAAPSGAELRAFLHKKLPDYMIPSTFVAFSELPLTSSGKLDRKALPSPDSASVEYAQPYLAPRDEVELELVKIWEDLLSVRRISVRDGFFDLGGHSLLGVQLMARIRRQFDRELPVGLLLQDPTIERLASVLRQERAPLRRSALIAINDTINGGDSRLPFFCVHPVGGNVLCYLELARKLGSDQPFYAFELPDQFEGTRVDSIETMAGHYLELLCEVQPQGPYRVGGWSMGGLVAFEMARSLSEAGERVDLVALIDCPAPGPRPSREEISDRVVLETFIEDIEGLSGQRMGIEDSNASLLEEAFGFIASRMRAMEMAPLEFGLPELRRLFAQYQIGLKAMLSYEPREYRGDVALLRATASTEERNGDHTLGWSRLVAGEVEVEKIEGDHYSIMAGPPVERLAQILRKKLE